MNQIVKPYLLRAWLLGGIAILMGLVLSYIVYQSTEKVRENAIDLVEYRIPILTSINELIADLSEQERIIYEYYRSQDDRLFIQSSLNIKQAFARHLTVISAQPRFSSEAAIIQDKQHKIEAYFMEFYREMQKETDNWDEMRDILKNISHTREELLPTIKSIEKQTQITVKEGHSQTLSQMFITHWVVVAYGVFILLFTGVVSWYIRQYILNQAKSTRLALFSLRNPNPILSTNNLGEVTYANPACTKLLTNVGLDEKQTDKLLPSNFVGLRLELSKQKDNRLNIETRLGDKILQASIYWHKELDAYDIHIRDITEQIKAEQEVIHLAFTHQETNLPNHYRLNENIDELIEAQTPFSLGVIAIRQFNEKVNIFGSEVVSAIVRCLAKVITKNLPSRVRLYHVNESEFVLVCTNTLSMKALQKLVSNIAMATDKPLVSRFGEFFVECDFGFTLYPSHGVDYNSLYRNAHIALSIASKSDHENFCLFSNEFISEVEKSASLIEKLRHALPLDEFVLVYQPQYSLCEQKITGIETLIRWNHGNEIISPAEFIPLAEQSGLIVSIGQWILEQACIFAKSLTQKGHSDLVVAINVSPRQFSHPQFIESVKNAINLSGLPAKNLELEITEGVFMHNETNTIAVLHQLKNIGVELSIDDFGTGYSSLSYLKQFPVDKLKIDQSFIRDCHVSDEDKSIVKTIVNLGKSLGLSLIAEGVEEREHVEYLTELGCDEIQGYWFSRPLEKEKLINTN